MDTPSAATKAKVEQKDRRVVRRESGENGWTFKTLLSNVMGIIEANDRRYAEQFQAADRATQIAMVASEKAINAAMISAKEAVASALMAADKAVEKAALGQQKVNEGQNEFRAALKDAQQTFATRDALEAEARREREALEAVDRRVQVIEKTGAPWSGGPIIIDGLTTRLANLEKGAAAQAGKTSITTVLWSSAMSIAGAILISILIHWLTVK